MSIMPMKWLFSISNLDTFLLFAGVRGECGLHWFYGTSTVRLGYWWCIRSAQMYCQVKQKKSTSVFYWEIRDCKVCPILYADRNILGHVVNHQDKWNLLGHLSWTSGWKKKENIDPPWLGWMTAVVVKNPASFVTQLSWNVLIANASCDLLLTSVPMILFIPTPLGWSSPLKSS